VRILKNNAYRSMEKLAETWDKRLDAVLQEVPYLALLYVYEAVVGRIPKTPQFSAYRKSLRIVHLGGSTRDVQQYAVYSTLPRRTVRESHTEVILYVRAKSRMKRVPPAVLILEKYSPWTLSLLPFVPEGRLAEVVSRRVRPAEVRAVEDRLKSDGRKWKRELDRAGYREDDKRKEKLRRSIRTVPDLAFEALRLEFGLNGGKTNPHWRPSIRELTMELPKIWQSPRISRMLLNPSDTSWRAPEGSLLSEEPTSLAERLVAFQDALRLHI